MWEKIKRSDVFYIQGFSIVVPVAGKLTCKNRKRWPSPHGCVLNESPFTTVNRSLRFCWRRGTFPGPVHIGIRFHLKTQLSFFMPSFTDIFSTYRVKTVTELKRIYLETRFRVEIFHENAIFVFSCGHLKMEFFENDDVTRSNLTPIIFEKFSVFSDRFHRIRLDGRQKRRKNLRIRVDGQIRFKNATCGQKKTGKKSISTERKRARIRVNATTNDTGFQNV